MGRARLTDRFETDYTVHILEKRNKHVAIYKIYSRYYKDFLGYEVFKIFKLKLKKELAEYEPKDKDFEQHSAVCVLSRKDANLVFRYWTTTKRMGAFWLSARGKALSKAISKKNHFYAVVQHRKYSVPGSEEFLTRQFLHEEIERLSNLTKKQIQDRDYFLKDARWQVRKFCENGKGLRFYHHLKGE